MNTMSSQRVVPLRARKRAHNKKIKLSQEEVDRRRRRHQMLQRYDAEYRRRTGRKLNMARISRNSGYSDGRASGIFHGHEPLNIEWMLIFAQAYDVAPQKIWREEWPFPDMTPSGIPPSFAKLAGVWETLPDTEKESISKILKR